jgi:hypothetical protein
MLAPSPAYFVNGAVPLGASMISRDFSSSNFIAPAAIALPNSGMRIAQREPWALFAI